MVDVSCRVDALGAFGMVAVLDVSNVSCVIDVFYLFGMKELFFWTNLNVRGSPSMVGGIDCLRWPKRETREAFICTWFKILQSIQ